MPTQEREQRAIACAIIRSRNWHGTRFIELENPAEQAAVHFVWDNMAVLPTRQRHPKTRGRHQPHTVAVGLFLQSGDHPRL
ncbi:hypothetical protein [Nocardia sp. NPDC059195]|uniref:hypothetical protein n=1 Tax=Nocardia sp. NPDC059195 TaxID=3346765 RepID=UPI0036746DB1